MTAHYPSPVAKVLTRMEGMLAELEANPPPEVVSNIRLTVTELHDRITAQPLLDNADLKAILNMACRVLTKTVKASPVPGAGRSRANGVAA
jgi:hypothetical protein